MFAVNHRKISDRPLLHNCEEAENGKLFWAENWLAEGVLRNLPDVGHVLAEEKPTSE